MTNPMESHCDSILSAVRECDPANLPVLIGALEQAKAEAWGRLSTPVVPLPQETKSQERLRTPEEAASIAQVPVRRLYGWAWPGVGPSADQALSPDRRSVLPPLAGDEGLTESS